MGRIYARPQILIPTSPKKIQGPPIRLLFIIGPYWGVLGGFNRSSVYVIDKIDKYQ